MLREDHSHLSTVVHSRSASTTSAYRIPRMPLTLATTSDGAHGSDG